MVTIGLIGAGFMGHTHASAYSKCLQAHIKSIADVRKERAEMLAQEFKAQAVEDIDAIITDPSIDLVDIALPTPAHAQTAVRAFQAGKHVLVEKPIALSLEDARLMLENARAAGRFLMVAHVVRFWPEYVVIQEILKDQRLGLPCMASAYRLTNLPQWSSWFQDPALTGGAVIDLHIHDLDVLNWFFGKPKSVFSTGLQDTNGGWNSVLSVLEYPSVKASAEASFMMPRDFPFSSGIRILCERGVIEFAFRAGGASFEQGQSRTHLLIHEDGKPNQVIPFTVGDAFENEIQYFVQRVELGQPPERVTSGDAYLALKVALAARNSLVIGEKVAIP